jgi:hypothetical protein
MSSSHDRKILNSIMNPLIPIGEAVQDDPEEEVKKFTDPEEEDTEAVR